MICIVFILLNRPHNQLFSCMCYVSESLVGRSSSSIYCILLSPHEMVFEVFFFLKYMFIEMSVQTLKFV